MPDRDSVRLEEFVNSFDYGYEPPTDAAFAIHVDGAPDAVHADALGPAARSASRRARSPSEARTPVSLTFVIDTSGSMAMEDRLELVKEALGLLVTRLGADDSVAIVAFGTDASVVLDPTSAAEPQAILAPSTRSSRTARPTPRPASSSATTSPRSAIGRACVDRVVLASDGVANVGLTDADSILQRIDREVDAGVELVAVGVGMGNFNDVLLEQLADRGNGFYAYVNDALEAERVFGSELVGHPRDRRPRRQGPGRVRPERGPALPPAGLREPAHRRPGLHRSVR